MPDPINNWDLCKAARERVLTDEPLDDGLSAHLETCVACRAFLKDVAVMRRDLAFLAPAPLTKNGETVAAAVMREIDAQKAFTARRLPRYARHLGLVAALAVITFAALPLLRMRVTKNADQAAPATFASEENEAPLFFSAAEDDTPLTADETADEAVPEAVTQESAAETLTPTPEEAAGSAFAPETAQYDYNVSHDVPEPPAGSVANAMLSERKAVVAATEAPQNSKILPEEDGAADHLADLLAAENAPDTPTDEEQTSPDTSSQATTLRSFSGTKGGAGATGGDRRENGTGDDADRGENSLPETVEAVGDTAQADETEKAEATFLPPVTDADAHYVALAAEAVGIPVEISTAALSYGADTVTVRFTDPDGSPVFVTLPLA